MSRSPFVVVVVLTWNDIEMTSRCLESVLANVDVELVHGAAADELNSVGGVGAVLYYAIDEAP